MLKSMSTDPPQIPDYTLLRPIGTGAYGQVWLAQNVLGSYRAVKIVSRKMFNNEEPFQREFDGIRKFEAASGTDPGLVTIFHVGKNERSGFFHYVMEAGDDLETGQRIAPDKYVPRTLDTQVRRKGPLPLKECVKIGIALARALECLHEQRLVHRDIKPANVVFVKGKPKLADVGLVTEIGHSTPLGTMGYLCWQAPSTPAGDVHSLAKLLYAVSTGKRAQAYPELPASWHTANPGTLLGAFRKVLSKGCGNLLGDCYKTAGALRADLELVLAGKSALTTARPSKKPAARESSPVKPGAPPPRLTCLNKKALGEEQRLRAGEIHLTVDALPKAHLNARALFVLERGLKPLMRGDGPVTRILLDAWPTLDDMLAATFISQLLQGKDLPAGADAFARYAELVREGLRPGTLPPETALEGMYLGVRSLCANDLSDPAAGGRFAERWGRMADCILKAAEANVDPFTTPLFPPGGEFAREQAFLAKDRAVYQQDVLRGDRWRIHLPGGPPRASALILREPKSILFKWWCRADPDTSVGSCNLLLGIGWGDGSWVFSTDRAQRLSLKPLVESLQAAETDKGSPRGVKRIWYPGERFEHTLIASPPCGTLLSAQEVLAVVRRWTKARASSGGTGSSPRSRRSRRSGRTARA